MKKFWNAFKEEIRLRGVKTLIETTKMYGPAIFFGTLYGYIAGQMEMSTPITILTALPIFGVFFWAKNAYLKIRRKNES